SGGNLAGGGTLVAPVGTTLAISSPNFRQLLGHTIQNNGTVNWSATGEVRADGGTNVINNAGTWNATAGGQLNGNAAPVSFNNTGSFVKTGAGTTTSFAGSAPFNNDGALIVQSGTLAVSSLTTTTNSTISGLDTLRLGGGTGTLTNNGTLSPGI